MDILLFFFLGASIASFLSLIVDRFPEKSIIFPASHCDSCGQQLTVRDLIPIFSQLINHSNCRFCHTKIPFWYGLLEIYFGVIVVLYYCALLSLDQVFILFFSTTLSLYDLKRQEFPLLIWLLPSIFLLFVTPISALAIILLAFGIVAELIDLKIGSGDFFYLASLSLLLDLQTILWIIELGSLSGIIYYFFQTNKRIPFVPFLFLGYLIFLFLTALNFLIKYDLFF